MLPKDDYGIRDTIGIAIDGGGVRGTIVAHGLIELENILGTRPLINDPRVKVLAGTSTGALIAGALAIGMTGEEILALYHRLGEKAFSKAGTIRPFGTSIPLISRLRLPIRLVRLLERAPLSIGEFLLYVLMPARYSFDPLRGIMRDALKAQPALGSNPTLCDVGEFLSMKPNNPTLIITAVEVAARQTHFLKTTPGEQFDCIHFIDALLASSAIPTYFDPIPVPSHKPTRWLVDGGVGNFGNPALVAAWELCDVRNPDRCCDPRTVTLFSFGTGYVPTEIYQQTYGSARNWWALEWAERAIDLFVDDTIREQTRSILGQYQGIDLRRYQVMLDRVVDPDRFDLIDSYLQQKGQELRQLIREDRHAFASEAAGERHDPEGLSNPANMAQLPVSRGSP